MKKNYIIPFFVVHEGCPEKCIFCDQGNITGHKGARPEEVRPTIERFLSTMPDDGVNVEAAFFGGTFTGLPKEDQEKYLLPAHSFVEKGRLSGIRVSTRPDFIDHENLLFMKELGVVCVELGVQSMSDGVLSRARRGYSEKDIERSSGLIKDSGLVLGHQIMVGLPESGFNDEIYTVKRSVRMGINIARIYPVIVIKNTYLAQMWERKEYKPLSEDEAVERCKSLVIYLEAYNVKVIRCGLHPSDGLMRGDSYHDGPFHVSFRQKVGSRIFREMIEHVKCSDADKVLYNPKDASLFFGYSGSNRDIVEKYKIRYAFDDRVPRGSLSYIRGTEIRVFDKKELIKDL